MSKTQTAIKRFWIFAFVCWVVFLSGAAPKLLGSPGFIQSLHLQKVLVSRKALHQQRELELEALNAEKEALEASPSVQEKEVRRVLGYVSRDEIIFELK